MSFNSAGVTPSTIPQVRLKANAIAVPALASNVRPALVLAERESRQLIEAAKHHDVSLGGIFCSGPTGIQVWNQPWDDPQQGPGASIHLGSVDWTYDTPVKHYVTIYRAMVTENGVAMGESTLSVLTKVLGLTGIPIDGARISMPAPPPRDPFRRRV
ncbi:MAG: hypothetical protein OEW41_00590 [Actinomycetota bacterium]|jgi:hypothetical protein|nr:hypothetical protein [Actinomycetota bacterium]